MPYAKSHYSSQTNCESAHHAAHKKTDNYAQLASTQIFYLFAVETVRDWLWNRRKRSLSVLPPLQKTSD